MKTLHYILVVLPWTLFSLIHCAQEQIPLKRARNTTSIHAADQTLTTISSILIREISAHVPVRDIPALSLSCHTINAALQGHLQQNTLPILPRSLVPELIQETTDPIGFVSERAQDPTLPIIRPLVRIHGRQVPTQEVLDTLYQSIIENLQTKTIDPIRYVCLQAQGQPTVMLYGKTFDTTKILQALTTQEETPLRIRSDKEDQNTYNIDHFLSTLEDADIFPACDSLGASESFLQTLNPEDRLDYVEWQSIRYQGSLLQELLPELNKLYSEHPQKGIVLSLDNDEILTREGTRALATYPITAIHISSARLPEGIGVLSNLKHLRSILIDLDDNANLADGTLIPSELCQLTELRALDITAPESQTAKLVIPAEINNLKKLQYLRLDTFKFNNSLAYLKNIPHLRILKLISPKFIEFPKALCNCNNIQWLYWEVTDENHQDIPEFTEIPAAIENLKKLRALRLSYGEKTIMILPSSIGHLKSLSHLNLSISHIQAIPQEIKHMKALCSLDLMLCNTPRIPDEICELPNISNVYLSTSPLFSTDISFKTLKYLLDHNALHIDLTNFQLLRPLMELREALLPYQRNIYFFNTLPINQEVRSLRRTFFYMRNFILEKIPKLLNGSIQLKDLEQFIDTFKIHPIYLSHSDMWTADQYFASALFPFTHDFEQHR
jgi:Leucine-rich repeat (LRR) protein